MELQKRAYPADGDLVCMVKQKLENFYKQIIEELRLGLSQFIWCILFLAQLFCFMIRSWFVQICINIIIKNCTIPGLII